MEINCHYRKKKPQRCGLSVHQRRCLGPDSCLSRKNTGQVTRLNVSRVLGHETSDQSYIWCINLLLHEHFPYLFVCLCVYSFIYLPTSFCVCTNLGHADAICPGTESTPWLDRPQAGTEDPLSPEVLRQVRPHHCLI